MKLADTMIAWNPTTKEVRIGPVPDRTGWSAGLPKSVGACYLDFNEADDAGKLVHLFSYFVAMTVHDGLSPDTVHRVLMGIDEYRTEIEGEPLRD
jgi:hypothetical protein